MLGGFLGSPLEKIAVSAFRIPCDAEESDGTITWDATTIVVVEITSKQKTGIGFSYTDAAAAQVIKKDLAKMVQGAEAFDIPEIWDKMFQSVRNIGSRGIAASAISAVDVALWDLKAKILELPLCSLWGRARGKVPVYGSGGFTSYTDEQLAAQFSRWKKEGITKFKMKVGRSPSDDLERVKNARRVIGNESELFVDANGAYSRKQALEFAEKFHEAGVTWFEEPVSSDDLEGLNLLRNRAPAGMNIAAGEYGYDLFYFRQMLSAQAVDILQADATRCGGYTGFFQAATLSHSFSIPLSSHTAPSLHLHACLSHPNVIHMEYFHDHVRIEKTFFEGYPRLENGFLIPHLDRPGHGLELKKQEIDKYKIIEGKI